MQNKQNKRRVVWHSLECAVRVTACSCQTEVDVVHLLAIVTSVTDALKHTCRSGIGQCDAEGYLHPCVGPVVLVPNCSRCCAPSRDWDARDIRIKTYTSIWYTVNVVRIFPVNVLRICLLLCSCIALVRVSSEQCLRRCAPPWQQVRRQRVQLQRLDCFQARPDK